MIKDYIIMQFNSVVLIALGVYGYISSGSITALIAPAIGIILLGLSFPTKNESNIPAHIAVVITFITTIVFLIVGIKRSNGLVIVMGIITFICLALYIFNFFLKKRNKEINKP